MLKSNFLNDPCDIIKHSISSRIESELINTSQSSEYFKYMEMLNNNNSSNPVWFDVDNDGGVISVSLCWKPHSKLRNTNTLNLDIVYYLLNHIIIGAGCDLKAKFEEIKLTTLYTPHNEITNGDMCAVFYIQTN